MSVRDEKDIEDTKKQIQLNKGIYMIFETIFILLVDKKKNIYIYFYSFG